MVRLIFKWLTVASLWKIETDLGWARSEVGRSVRRYYSSLGEL